MSHPEAHDHTSQTGEQPAWQSEHADGKPPPPPSPSQDTSIIPSVKSPVLGGYDHLTVDNVDIFQLDAFAALKLVCRGIELLVRMTGDVPPTPPIRSRHSSPPRPAPSKQERHPSIVPGWNSVTANQEEQEHIDGVPFVKTPMGSPEAHPYEPSNIIHGENSQPLHVQHGALARKFFSKRPPPISLEDYLTRLHKYCPMSTAVYLATSCYISHLAVEERTLYVTPRNVHRLVLAGIRTAMKALEDLSWPHGRVAKVGGVSEAELGRLEITFCFLMSFNLRVTADQLTDQAKSLIRDVHRGDNDDVEEFGSLDGALQLKMPAGRATGEQGSGLVKTMSSAEKRKASSSLPMRPPNIDRSIGVSS